MKLDSKKILTTIKNPRKLFVLVVLSSCLAWVLWLYISVFAPLDVQVARTTKPLVSIDEVSYKEAAEYLDSVQAFTLPDFSQLYANPEPFLEYAR